MPDIAQRTIPSERPFVHAFEGELLVRMTGCSSNGTFLAPLSICVDRINGASYAIDEIDVPEDGSPVDLGKSGRHWLEILIVRPPVYDDMATYDYLEMSSSYWVGQANLDKVRTIVSIDLSQFGKIKLDIGYLRHVVETRIAHYRIGMRGFRMNSWLDMPSAPVLARYEKRIDELQAIGDSFCEAQDEESLIDLYSQICRADHLK